MKKIVSILVLAAIALGVNAQNMKDVTFQFTEASDLTLCGKMFNDTPTPYQRMDFSKSDKWSSKDINLLEMSSGISVAFETDSPIITVKVDWLEASEAKVPVSAPVDSTCISKRTANGFGLASFPGE